jgi:hypothetical protein
MNSNLKNALLVGAGALATVLLTKKSSALGDLNTAKTAKGRTRQRKAVFARMENEGSIFPKRNGKRTKPRKQKRK